ncbi:GyrI-like domain-containing protein [Thalassotalea atypica]|uniref:GyrI-like domain-containing protein n=1 Tax=Thalassotalea atypica TaxID=2054316 RepID=UPI00257472BD|nr:effector binding domain-containing protein [Thalassotalea atypica]
MEVRIVSKTIIHGFSTRTDNATEMNASTGRIPGLWQHFDQEVPVDYVGGERVYGAYFDYESNHLGQFTVLAGFDGKTVPPKLNLEKQIIPAGKYLVFCAQGKMPDIAINAWTDVWHYFSNENADHQRLHTVDFEYYPSGDQIEVHIAIK